MSRVDLLERVKVNTFEVFGREQDGAEVVLGDEVSDVIRHFGAVKAHCEELAQHPGRELES